jgi:sugar/nucleoside kinase (ribokinase family)
VNEREACKLAQTEDVEKALETLSQKVSMLVVKRGSRGATARAGKEKLSAFPPVVDMVDPIGAGDTFDAGFVHKFIRGAKIEECLKFANVAGALSVTRPGGTEAFRDAATREAFFRKNAGAPEAQRAPILRPKT